MNSIDERSVDENVFISHNIAIPNTMSGTLIHFVMPKCGKMERNFPKVRTNLRLFFVRQTVPWQ